MNVTIIGTGYVGLVTGACFAEKGNKVLCVDIDEQKVKKMEQKIVPFYEPGLEELFIENIDKKRLLFTTSLEEGIKHSNIIFLCLPTPENEDGSADLSYIINLVKNLSKKITGYTIIINKSTVPVGTATKVKQILLDENISEDNFDVVSNPEFLKQGHAVVDFLESERVVIGTQSSKVIELLKELYLPFVKDEKDILIMDEFSSELTKYAANSFLATKITFMNEISNYCEKIGANIDHIREGIGMDSRIGNKFLYPGIGYGGSCFPKDVKALIRSGEEAGFNFNIIKAVDDINQNQKTVLVDKVLQHFNEDIADKKIALWGLSFKPETDDTREAPSHYIIEKLISLGVKNIVGFDPQAIQKTKSRFGDKIVYSSSKYEALNDADALLICTEWTDFKDINLNEIKKRMKQAILFDGRNLYDINKIKSEGDITYYPMGKNPINR